MKQVELKLGLEWETRWEQVEQEEGVGTGACSLGSPCFLPSLPEVGSDPSLSQFPDEKNNTSSRGLLWNVHVIIPKNT